MKFLYRKKITRIFLWKIKVCLLNASHVTFCTFWCMFYLFFFSFKHAFFPTRFIYFHFNLYALLFPHVVLGEKHMWFSHKIYLLSNTVHYMWKVNTWKRMNLVQKKKSHLNFNAQLIRGVNSVWDTASCHVGLLQFLCAESGCNVKCMRFLKVCIYLSLLISEVLSSVQVQSEFMK